MFFWKPNNRTETRRIYPLLYFIPYYHCLFSSPHTTTTLGFSKCIEAFNTKNIRGPEHTSCVNNLCFFLVWRAYW